MTSSYYASSSSYANPQSVSEWIQKESLLSSPYRAITVQRMVHCQTRAQSEINAKSKGQNAEVLDDSTFQKRVDSLWKVGGIVSVGGGVEDTVTNAVRIGSVTHRWSCYQIFDLLFSFSF